jgi:prevent-host-death family protein
MDAIGVRELKQNASAVLARVRAGESFVVTDRGRPVARLTPLAGGSLTALREAGLIRRHTLSLEELPLPLDRAETDAPAHLRSLSDLVRADRDADSA